MKIGLISTDFYIYSHGLRAISSYLKEKGHETIFISMPYPIIKLEKEYELIDYSKIYPEKGIKEMLELIKDCDLIGISGMAITFKRSLQLINSIKPLGIPVMWGGIFPTTFPGGCIENCEMICVGEGEEPLLELANKLESGESIDDIQNLWIKKQSGKIIRNSLRPKIENLDQIPMVDFDLKTNYIMEENGSIVNLNEEHIGDWLFYHGIRGCIYTCKFCCNHQLDKIYEGLGSKIRKKSVKVMIKELEFLIEKFPEVKDIWFTDDDINMRTLSELEEFNKLYKEKINLPFKCYMSPTTVTEPKLKLLIDSGLKYIEFGVQTGSDRTNREVYGRPIFKKAVLRAAKIVNKYQDYMEPPNYQFITSNPYETKEDILETIKLIREIPAPFKMQAFGLVFFPGSPLYTKALSDGKIKSFEDSGYNIDYFNINKHNEIKNKNRYLNSLIHWMSGLNTSKKHGIIPRPLVDFMLKESTINFFEKSRNAIKSINNFSVNYNFRYNDIHKKAFNKLKGVIYSLVPKRIKEPIKKSLKLGEYSNNSRKISVFEVETENKSLINIKNKELIQLG